MKNGILMEKGKVVAIIQARMGSTRLPKKSMADISGKATSLARHTARKECKKIDLIVVATTNKPRDDPIVRLCRQERRSGIQGKRKRRA